MGGYAVRRIRSSVIALVVAAPLLVPALALPPPVLPGDPLPPGPTAAPALPAAVAALATFPAAWQDLLSWDEVHLLGAPLPSAVPPAPTAPSEGMLRIAQLTHADAAALPPDALAAFDALPPAPRDALSSLLNALAHQAELVPQAVPPVSVAQYEAHLADPRAPLPRPDYAALLGGQHGLLAAAQAALPVFWAYAEALADAPPIEICGALAIDFSAASSVRACDVAFLLDGGGDDLYVNNAGGSGSAPEEFGHFFPSGAGFALEMGGNDRYVPARGQGGLMGGAFLGSGLLIEVAGDDYYEGSLDSSGALNGGDNQGAGMMLDLAGNDWDDGHLGLNSAFHASGGGINGGTVSGAGLFVDVAGDDVHQGTIGVEDVNGAGGVNGGAHGGAGASIDYAGNDTYDGMVADLGGVNGGSLSGAALALDVAGNDRYDGGSLTDGGVNGGAWIGSGNLVDLAGDDDYDGFVGLDGGVNGGAFDIDSKGFQHDGGGNDHYTGFVGSNGGVNGASFFAEGTLVDLGGDDVYESWLRLGPTRGANGATFLGFGLLWDQGGSDLYRDAQGLPFQLDESILLKGVVGNQRDVALPGG